ncbi:MAG: DUF4034 domain-containing protein [Candidatus Ozemobacteraceae bacterium]
MKKAFLICVIGLLVIWNASLLFSQPLSDSEITWVNEKDEKDDCGKAALNLLQKEDFDGLEKYLRESQDLKIKHNDGIWRLNSCLIGFGPDWVPSDPQWSQLIPILEKWEKTKPESIFPKIAIGEFYIAYAWKARGTGWANSVTDEGRRLMRERLERASQTLMSAKELKEKSPGLFPTIGRLFLGIGMSKEEREKLYLSAIELEPDYPQFYLGMAYHLLPRWYGKEGEWENFAEDVYKNSPLGKEMYARIIWSFVSGGIYKNIFKESRADWQKTLEGLREWEKRFPKTESVKSITAFLAGQASDIPVQISSYEKIGKTVDLAIWRDKDRFLKAREWAIKNAR